MPRKKKKKKKKKRSASKPKMRSPLDVARNPQPYQIPLYYPPFPSVINQQPKQSGVQQAVASALRNYADINAAELRRLRGDLTAYRQEQQTAFHTNVAYPRATVNVGSFDGVDIDDINSVASSATAAEPDSDYVPSVASSVAPSVATSVAPSAASVSSFGRANNLVAGIKSLVLELDPTSPTDVSDFEGFTSGTSLGRGASGGGFTKSVSFGELPIAPRASSAARAAREASVTRQPRVYKDNASNRRLGRVGQSY